MRSKKGALPFTTILVVMMVFVLLYAWVELSNKYDAFERKMGERQYDLISTYQKAEKALFYIDNSAKYTSFQTIHDLGQKGGFNTSECGSYFGYNLWVNKDKEGSTKECYPEEESIEKNFTQIFNRNLNEYTSRYPDVKIPKNNYEISLKREDNKLRIIGNSILSLVLNIVKEEDIFSFRAEEALDIAPEKIEACIVGGVYAEEKGKKIVETARGYKEENEDLPYHWGGESREEGGFDCSGFVYNVFKDSGTCGFNYRLTARAYEKFYGKPVLDYSRLEPGDLVFIDYDENNVVDHVAIYAGDNKIIHSSSRNNGIMEEIMPEKYEERIYSVKRYALRQEGIA